MRRKPDTLLARVPADSATAAVNLRRLVWLRLLVLAGPVLAVAAAPAWLRLALPLVPLAAVLAAAVLVNAYTGWRLRRPRPVQDAELYAHLMFDVLVLTALLYLSGGSTNPFAPLYLLPLTLAAAALPARYTWSVAGLAAACYTALLFLYVPLPRSGVGRHDFQLHVFGMWLGFMLSAALVAYFVVRMRETLRERDRLRAEMRERELKNERMLALGTLAAGAAHELGTPLATMAVLVKDLARDPGTVPLKLETLRRQIERCKEILASLAAAVGQSRAEGGAPEALDAYLARVLQRWCAAHPEARVRVRWGERTGAPRIAADRTLDQALGNILNNAVDASPQAIEVDIGWSPAELAFEVRDRGPGLTAAVREHAGEPFFSTKEPGAGMGLGLFLARGAIERLGGSVRLDNRDGGGAVCRVRLPLRTLEVAAA